MTPAQVVTSEGGNGLRLFAEVDHDGQVSANVLVRWSITDDLRQLLIDSGATDPQLLLVVGRNGFEKSRKLVPLGNKYEFITFTGPGESVIYATIVWTKVNDYGQTTKPEKFFSKKDDNGNHQAPVLDRRNIPAEIAERRANEIREELWSSNSEDTTEIEAQLVLANSEYHGLLDVEENWRTTIRGFSSVNSHDGVAELAVDVDEEMFAQKPNRLIEWLASLAGKILESKPRDQCAMRRRAILGAVIAIGWIPVHAVIAFFYALALMSTMVVNLLFIGLSLFFGRRGMKSEFAYDPFNYFVKDILRAGHHSFWLYRKQGERIKYTRRHSIFNVLNPPVICAVAFVALIVSMFFGTFLHIMAYSAIVLVFVVVLVAIISRNPSAKALNRQQAAEEERAKRLRDQQMGSLGALVTSKDFVPGQISLDDIPSGRATLHLRYNGLKAKICKPFAR